MYHKTAATTVVLFALTTVVSAETDTRGQGAERTVNLTAEEAKDLQRIMAADEYLKEMSAAQEGLESLNKLASFATPGPAKLFLKWNEGALKGWGKANSNLEKIGKARACDGLLILELNSTDNAAFFADLQRVRGCSN